MNIEIVLLFVFAYFLGSFPTGKLIGRARGIDIQKNGSGNIGFANAVRVLGWQAGIIVLVVDILKGFMPVYIAHYSFGATIQQQMIIGIAPIIGHAYPIWLRFKGGKSIATGLGVLIALNPLIATLGITVYLMVFMISRKSAAGSLTAAWSLPLIAFIVQPMLCLYFIILALFATYTHRANIRQFIYEYNH